MKEKIKKISKLIVSIGAVIWIFAYIVSSSSNYELPSLAIIIGIAIMWVITMYLLKEKPQSEKIFKKEVGFCEKCGCKINENSIFCTQCGAKIN